ARSSNNTITRNIISANYGPGVLVGAANSGNRISQNSIFANGTITVPGGGGPGGGGPTGQIGIDLLTATDHAFGGTEPFVPPHAPGDADPGGNALLNFPVLTKAQIGTAGVFLELSGFTVGQPGMVIELFISDGDPSGFGEGQTYLLTLTEGSAADLDG